MFVLFALFLEDFSSPDEPALVNDTMGTQTKSQTKSQDLHVWLESTKDLKPDSMLEGMFYLFSSILRTPYPPFHQTHYFLCCMLELEFSPSFFVAR